jgi:phosphoribosylglycinamide formyltransferase 1
MTRKPKAAILISGRGSNMMALVEAAKDPSFPLEFCLIVANDPQAKGLIWAQEQGLEVICIDHKPYGQDRIAHERAIDAVLEERSIEFICLAGYMRVITPFLVEAWAGRMINIHPSLLPNYKGLNTHERVLAAGDSEHGCSVHWVSCGVDEGAVIAQACVPVLPFDTTERLSQRLLLAEHKLYPEAIKLIFKTST